MLTVGKSHKKLFDPVSIHFDFDNFKPDLMTKRKTKRESDPVVYEIFRMVPPGKSEYFYTVNHEEFFAQDQPKVYSKIKTIIKNIEFEEVLEDDGRPLDSEHELEDEQTEFNYSIAIMNFTSGKTKPVVNDSYVPVNKQCCPRPPDRIYVRPLNRRPKTPWSLPISIFKDYQIETQELLVK